MSCTLATMGDPARRAGENRCSACSNANNRRVPRFEVPTVYRKQGFVSLCVGGNHVTALYGRTGQTMRQMSMGSVKKTQRVGWSHQLMSPVDASMLLSGFHAARTSMSVLPHLG